MARKRNANYEPIFVSGIIGLTSKTFYLTAGAIQKSDFLHSSIIGFYYVLRDGAHFNFPKLHMLTHFRSQIERFGCLEMWATKLGELLHRALVKDPYKRSNKCGDYTLQILNETLKDAAFVMRKMNIDHARNASRDPACSTSPYVLSEQKLRSCQRRIRIFEQLNEDIAVGEFVSVFEKYARASRISSYELWEYPICVYHAYDLPISNTLLCPMPAIQTIRCTINTTWQSNSPRRDWAWIAKKSSQKPSVLPDSPRNFQNFQFRIIELSLIIQCTHLIVIPAIYSITGLNTEDEWLANYYIDIYSWSCQSFSCS